MSESEIKILAGAGSTKKESGLLLPENVQKQIEAETAKKEPQGFEVPPQMAAQVYEHLDTAKEVDALLEKMGIDDIATIALLTQPAVRKFLQNHLNGVMPQLSHTLCRQDRVSMHQVMMQVTEDRKAKAMLQKEKLDIPSYAQAVSDYYHAAGQVPVPAITLAVTAPILPPEIKVVPESQTESSTTPEAEQSTPE